MHAVSGVLKFETLRVGAWVGASKELVRIIEGGRWVESAASSLGSSQV